MPRRFIPAIEMMMSNAAANMTAMLGTITLNVMKTTIAMSMKAAIVALIICDENAFPRLASVTSTEKLSFVRFIPKNSSNAGFRLSISFMLVSITMPFWIEVPNSASFLVENSASNLLLKNPSRDTVSLLVVIVIVD